ncbi:mitochondrial coenzyme A diphosphatase NUDT8 [Marmota marmota marmota]|nr:mitochondrial coenzyme A diphosphatase NUDT8 [Marmota marmota marmota]
MTAPYQLSRHPKAQSSGFHIPGSAVMRRTKTVAQRGNGPAQSYTANIANICHSTFKVCVQGWYGLVLEGPGSEPDSLCLLSFPGGKCDPADQDVVHTALRETQEELGLAVSEEQVWGILQPVHDTRKATVVPVLASVGPLDLQSLKPNPEEVDEVFVLPLAHLLQTQNQGYTHFCQDGHFRYTLPVFLHGPHRIWGLTAVVTDFTLQLLAPGAYQPRLISPELHPG